MQSVIESSREIPLETDVDVAVVGGGTAGVMAAVAAARSGARTCLIERTGALGGMIQLGLMGHFGNRFRDGQGHETVTGAPRELLEAVVRDGATPYATLQEALRAGHHIFYRHEHAGRACLRMVRQANVELWLHAVFARAQPAPERGYDLFIECKGGRRAIRAKQVVDCTGEADVAFSLGAAFHEDKALRFSWGLLFEMGLIDLARYEAFLKTCEPLCPPWTPWLAHYLRVPEAELAADRYWGEWLDGHIRAWPFRRQIMQAVEAGDFDLVRPLPEGGTVRYGWDGFWPEPWHGADTVTANVCMVTGLNPADPRHVTRAEVAAREYAFDFLAFLRKYLPGFEKAVIRTMSGQTVPRGGREIVGEASLTSADFGQRIREDAICLVDLSPVGLPLGMFVPKGWRDLLVAGRCADQGYSVRASVSCMAAGYSCGAIAALAAQRGVSPLQLDLQERRRSLETHGVRLTPGPIAPDFAPLKWPKLPGVPQHDADEGLVRAKKLS